MALVNCNIAKDNLWRGRFVIYQVGGRWKAYNRARIQTWPIEYYYWVQLIMLDKKLVNIELFVIILIIIALVHTSFMR